MSANAYRRIEDGHLVGRLKPVTGANTVERQMDAFINADRDRKSCNPGPGMI